MLEPAPRSEPTRRDDEPRATPPGRIQAADVVARGPGLSRRMRAASRAVAEALFTTEAGPPAAGRIDWLCDDLDHFLAHAGPRARRMFALCIFAISLLAPLHVLRLPPFRRLLHADRVRALERMEAGPFSLAVFGAKAILCILYFEHPGPAREIGFDGECLGAPPAAGGAAS